MKIDGWKYYCYAAIPTTAPHKQPDLSPIVDGRIWELTKGKKKPLLARWTENYDCGHETAFWYCILDKPFDIKQVKGNIRYKINKGNRLFEIKQIEPLNYTEELFHVSVAAYEAYPPKYRPAVNYDVFCKQIENYSASIKNNKTLFYGAFFQETQELCGYHIVNVEKEYMECNTLKVMPSYEKYQINAALVYKWVIDATAFIENGGYLHNGTKSINHETAFQEYLEHYFGFRKAYCDLKVVYKPNIKILIKFLFCFRKILGKIDSIRVVHSINSVLKMEEITRNGRKQVDKRKYKHI